MSVRKILILTILVLTSCLAPNAADWQNPKREFRGAWLHTVYQQQYSDLDTDKCKAYLSAQLDSLKSAGVNAVIFQVRPSADALYDSKYEPWSRFLTKGGKPPRPYWDPLAYMCDEAHRRGMELHAWLNPYRVTTAKNETPAPGHIYHKHPERFVRYSGDGRLYFDPGLPENRQYIIDIVNDIVERYDVDAIHIDDYFYPYPVAGKDFGDAASYARYGSGKKLADWRRENIDQLIRGIHDALRSGPKPWVRFGVSPFGIWRNRSTDPRGSDTSGLQMYDALYADPLKWAEQGWIDYLVPQLYWELDHKRASYTVLIDWWARNIRGDCHLYIGQDVDRCLSAADTGSPKAPNQLERKIRLSRQAEAVSGNCWWPGYLISRNDRGVADALRRGAQSTIALVPEYSRPEGERPQQIKSLSVKDGVLSWRPPGIRGRVSDPARYVVYRFANGVKADFDNPACIMDITGETSIAVTPGATYHVTVLDHANRESAPSPGAIYK